MKAGGSALGRLNGGFPIVVAPFIGDKLAESWLDHNVAVSSLYTADTQATCGISTMH